MDGTEYDLLGAIDSINSDSESDRDKSIDENDSEQSHEEHEMDRFF